MHGANLRRIGGDLRASAFPRHGAVRREEPCLKRGSDGLEPYERSGPRPGPPGLVSEHRENSVSEETQITADRSQLFADHSVPLEPPRTKKCPGVVPPKKECFWV